MKKTYVTPTIEKIAFRYRDQVVAASGDPVVSPSNPRPGTWTDSPGASGCSYYLVEVLGWGVCNYM